MMTGKKMISIAWLFFHKKVDEEFEDYLNKVVTKGQEDIKLKISITKFRLKQTMFSNGKRAQYLYAYELEREINKKLYTTSIEGKVKIENIDEPKRVLDSIKISLWKLLSEKLTE